MVVVKGPVFMTMVVRVMMVAGIPHPSPKPPLYINKDVKVGRRSLTFMLPCDFINLRVDNSFIGFILAIH